MIFPLTVYVPSTLGITSLTMLEIFPPFRYHSTSAAGLLPSEEHVINLDSPTLKNPVKSPRLGLSGATENMFDVLCFNKNK